MKKNEILLEGKEREYLIGGKAGKGS